MKNVIGWLLLILVALASGCNKANIQSGKQVGDALTPPTTPLILSATQNPLASPQVVLNGETFEFKIKFTEAVKVNGSPRIPLTIGSSTRYALLSSGDNTDELTFTYTVTNGDLDQDRSVGVGSFDLNGGSIESTTHQVPADLSGLALSSYANTEVDGEALVAPVLSLPSQKVFITGYRQEFTIDVTDPNVHDDHTFLISSSTPGWSTSNISAGTNGKIVMASNAVPGTYAVNVVVDDGHGGSDSGSFNLIIAPQGGASTPVSIYDTDSGCGTRAGTEFMCGHFKYVPTAYDTYNTERFCALIYFHGNGGSGTGSLVSNSLYETIGAPPGSTTWEAGNPGSLAHSSGKHYPCLVFTPQRSGEWDVYSVKNMITHLVKNFRIDPDRVYTAGVSYGGSGTGHHMFFWGHELAAASPNHAHNIINPAGASASQPESLHHAINYLNTTQWTIHGEQDDTPWDGSARYTVTRTAINNSLNYVMNYSGNVGSAFPDGADYTALLPFEADPVTWLAGFNIDLAQKMNRLTVRNNVGHSGMNFVYNNQYFNDWMFSQRLDKGIRVNGLALTPSVVTAGVATDVRLSLNLKDVGGALSKVFVDLTSVGGSNRVDLMKGYRHDWSHTFSVNSTAGTKILKLNITDNEGHLKTIPVVLDVVDGSLPSGGVVATYKVSFGFNDPGCNAGADWTLINSNTNTDWVYYSFARKGRFFRVSEASGMPSAVKLVLDYTAIDDQTDTTYNQIQGPGNAGDISSPPAPFNANALQCYWYTRTLNGRYSLAENNLKFKIEGLNRGLTYRLYTIGSINNATQLGINFTITDNSGSATYFRETNTTVSNTAKMLTVANLVPREDGSIIIKVDESDPTHMTNSWGRINGLVLEAIKP